MNLHSISTESKEESNTLLRMRRNSLDLNSLRADFWRRSMRSSPLRSMTSSLISSVVLALISFNSSSLLAIITNDEVDCRFNFIWGEGWMKRTPRSWMPLKEDLGFPENAFGRQHIVEGEATEFNIFASFSKLFLLEDEAKAKLGLRIRPPSKTSLFILLPYLQVYPNYSLPQTCPEISLWPNLTRQIWVFYPFFLAKFWSP